MEEAIAMVIIRQQKKTRSFMSVQEQKVLVEVRTPILPGILVVKVDIMEAEMVVMVVLV